MSPRRFLLLIFCEKSWFAWLLNYTRIWAIILFMYIIDQLGHSSVTWIIPLSVKIYCKLKLLWYPFYVSHICRVSWKRWGLDKNTSVVICLTRGVVINLASYLATLTVCGLSLYWFLPDARVFSWYSGFLPHKNCQHGNVIDRDNLWCSN